MIFKRDICLRNYSSFRIGGKAKYFKEFRSLKELKESLTEIKKRKIPFFVIGEGTNILFPDTVYKGVILKNSLQGISKNNNKLLVKSGTSFSKLLDFCVKHRLSGLEWAAGLRGTMGGAIFSNAGAFGKEIKDVIVSVKSLCVNSLSLIERNQKQCFFNYRNSIFRNQLNKEIIIEAELSLSCGKQTDIKKKIDYFLKKRKINQPLDYSNIGSIFKNPVCESAGKLIEKAGVKGVSRGEAMISLKHGNFIVNLGKAKSRDVLYLINLIKKEVNKKFGIKLEEEIIIV